MQVDLESPILILIVLVVLFGTIIYIGRDIDQIKVNYYVIGQINGADHTVKTLQYCNRQRLTAEDFNQIIKQWQDSLRNRATVDKVGDPLVEK